MKAKDITERRSDTTVSVSVSLRARLLDDRAGEGPSVVFIGTRFGVVEGETLAGGATPLFFGVAGEDDAFSPSVIVAIELLLVIPPASTLFRLLCEAEPSSDRLAREMSSFDKSAAPSSPVFDFRCHSCTLTKRYRFRARIDADRRPVVAYLPRPCRSGNESDREDDCFFEPVGRVVVPVFSHSKDTSEKRLRHTVSSSATKTEAMHSHDPEVGVLGALEYVRQPA